MFKETVKIEDLMGKSVDKLEEDIAVIDFNGTDIEIKKFLTLNEVSEFVKAVSSSCFDDEGIYSPEKVDFTIKLETIDLYTNIEISGDISVEYDYICASGIYDRIAREVDEDQYDEILNACRMAIGYKTKTNIDAINNEIISLRNSLFESVDEFESSLSEIFKGVTNDDLKGIINSISNIKLDPEELMKAYFDNK